jgi:hypothetical protein
MASSVVIRDATSLAQNFSENSKQVLCSAAFGAGAYAIGGSLLGFPPLTPAGALVTGGALLAALTLCPSGASGDAVFGTPPPFQGGQCPVQYYVKVDLAYADGHHEYPEQVVYGRVKGLDFVDPPGPPAYGLYLLTGSASDPNAVLFLAIYLGPQSNISSYSIIQLSRMDGNPDDCGNLPRSGGQIVRSPGSGDTLNPSTVIDNRDYSTVIPVEFNLGGISNTLNLRFGEIRIGSLLPLNFNINIGGADYRFRQKPDGDLEPVETNPDSSGASDRTEELLKKIKECVCTPAVDLDLLLLPVVSDGVGCELVTETLLVPKGSVSDAQFERLVASANLAREGCLAKNVEQLPQSLIFSASTTDDGREIFTGKIKPDVISLILKITEIRESGPPKINLYAASNQRKFGSVSFVTDGVSGGGDYIYVFDEETYLPLPVRGKEGRLRILMKKGLTFEVYDSGERV